MPQYNTLPNSSEDNGVPTILRTKEDIIADATGRDPEQYIPYLVNLHGSLRAAAHELNQACQPYKEPVYTSWVAWYMRKLGYANAWVKAVGDE